jgi:hypothetical protein
VNNLLQRLSIHVVRISGATRSALKTNSSSSTNGIERARANGQPTMAPAANRRVAARVLRLFCALEGASAYENAKVVIYMANEEGRSAGRESTIYQRGKRVVTYRPKHSTFLR